MKSSVQGIHNSPNGFPTRWLTAVAEDGNVLANVPSGEFPALRRVYIGFGDYDMLPNSGESIENMDNEIEKCVITVKTFRFQSSSTTSPFV